MEELIQQLIEYLKIQSTPPSLIEIISTQIVPIISIIIIALSSIAGAYKYIQTKNREIYIDVLNSVYVPLYEYFVKQELYSSIHLPDRDYHESPILEVRNQKITYKLSSGKSESIVENSTLFNLERNNFIKIKDEVNLGLASIELLTLLNMYEVLIFMESKYDKGTQEQAKASVLKVKVENDIRKEVISGYQKYRKSLGLKSLAGKNIWNLTSDQIVYNFDIDDKVNELIKDMEESPNKYGL